MKHRQLIAAGSSLAAALTAVGGLFDGATVRAADAPTGGPPGVMAFVLTNVYVPAADEPGVCRTLAKSEIEVFYDSLSAPERARYGDTESAFFRNRDGVKLMYERLGFKLAPFDGAFAPQQPAKPTPARLDELRAKAGIPAGKGGPFFGGRMWSYDACTDPQDFPQLAKEFKTYDGKIAYGIDLDGHRRRDDFVSPDGERGVDNQLWRVIGCIKHFREYGDTKTQRSVISSASAPVLVELSGIDDPRNDDDVTVSVYSGATAITRDGKGGALAYASYDINPDARLQARTHGRIVNGELRTEPFDLNMRFKEQVVDMTRELRGARLRATLQADGSIAGGIYGYYLIDNFFKHMQAMGGILITSLLHVPCVATYQALQQYADGIPDPVTGRNTGISAAFNFVGVPAFVIHGTPAPRERPLGATTVSSP